MSGNPDAKKTHNENIVLIGQKTNQLTLTTIMIFEVCIK